MATRRRKIEEYEADLYRVHEPTFLNRFLSWFFRTKSGEIEIELHGVRTPDGSSVSAVIDGKSICQVKVNRGRGRLLLSTAQGDTVPEVGSGSVAEIHYMEQVLLKGTFRPD